jgi:hypothetical protein
MGTRRVELCVLRSAMQSIKRFRFNGLGNFTITLP